jgi:hypothetical protein
MIEMDLKYIVIQVFVLLVSSLTAFAQEDEAKAYFTALRNHQPVNSFTVHVKKEDRYLKAISPYLADTLPLIRAEAYYLLANAGIQSQQKATRREVVNRLLHGFRDRDTGIKGRVENALTRFKVDDFDRAAVDTLKKLIADPPPLPGKLFKLAGYLNLHELAPGIKAHIEQEPARLRDKDRWAGYLALARMGDQQALDIILNRVRTFGASDDVVYEIFPDLVYTRSYRAIHYLQEVVFSDEQNCSSPHADSREKTNCAYRVIELLAPVLKGYPLALDASGDLATSNYPEALGKIRDWFTQQNGNYEILRDTF